MGGDAYTFQLFGLTFSKTNVISGTCVFLITFFVLFGLSRHIQMKPKGAQNVFEWIVDFTNGIVRSQMKPSQAVHYNFFMFVLFCFIFIANQFGLILNFSWNNHEILRSPTADPVVTMTLSMIILTLSHYAGVKHNGLKGYLVSFAKPMGFLLPINIVEEFANFLTLGLRIFGNIFAGELLLKLLAQMGFSHGWWTLILSMPLEVVWQGFSIFLGSIQAYVFVVLSSVYISQKISGE